MLNQHSRNLFFSQMNAAPVTTISFLHFKGLSASWNGFRQMGLSRDRLKGIPGMTFGKMLGTGAGQGFKMWPNWNVYGLLQCWSSESSADSFFSTHPWWQLLLDYSDEQWTTYMQAVKTHGTWDGMEPFHVASGSFQADDLVGVLTRATIARAHLWHFWSRVARVSRAITDIPHKPLFSMGIGELPVIQQATFSFWRSTHEMTAYAYKHPYHKEVVSKTRKNGWYAEELFARFRPYRSTGTWNGPHPLQSLL